MICFDRLNINLKRYELYQAIISVLLAEQWGNSRDFMCRKHDDSPIFQCYNTKIRNIREPFINWSCMASLYYRPGMKKSNPSWRDKLPCKAPTTKPLSCLLNPDFFYFFFQPALSATIFHHWCTIFIFCLAYFFHFICSFFLQRVFPLVKLLYIKIYFFLMKIFFFFLNFVFQNIFNSRCSL